MHTGITAHPTFIDETNLKLLDDRTFVFLAMDDAQTPTTNLCSTGRPTSPTRP